MSVFASVVAGAETSCGLLLLVAGGGKTYHAARGAESDTALRRALHVPVRRWRWVEFSTGVVEILTAVAVLFWPAGAGAMMAALGLVFCGLLWYVKAAGVPGGCNCLGGRRFAADSVGIRDIVRAGVLAVVGVAGAVTAGRPGAPVMDTAGMTGALSFWGGFLIASAVLAALSVPPPRRACNRPLLSPVRGTLRALTANLVYQAMAQHAGPFSAEIGYRREGCDDEFWFMPEAGGTPVVFAVGHNGTGAAGQGLTIRTTRPREGIVMPLRRLSAPVR